MVQAGEHVEERVAVRNGGGERDEHVHVGAAVLERAVRACVELAAEDELHGRGADEEEGHAALDAGQHVVLERLAQPRVRQHHRDEEGGEGEDEGAEELAAPLGRLPRVLALRVAHRVRLVEQRSREACDPQCEGLVWREHWRRTGERQEDVGMHTPSCCTATTRSFGGTSPECTTWPRLPMSETDTSRTPGTATRARSTAPTHAAHVMPLMASSTLSSLVPSSTRLT